MHPEKLGYLAPCGTDFGASESRDIPCKSENLATLLITTAADYELPGGDFVENCIVRKFLPWLSRICIKPSA